MSEKCCERDYNSDGNCDIHESPGVLRRGNRIPLVKAECFRAITKAMTNQKEITMETDCDFPEVAIRLDTKDEIK